MNRRFGCFLIVICLGGSLLTFQTRTTFAEDTIDVDNIFSDSDTVVSQDTVVEDNVDRELKAQHIGFSGQIDTSITYTDYAPFDSNNDWTKAKGKDQVQLLNEADANLFLDIRLQRGVKGFLSAGIGYVPALDEEQQTALGIKDNTTLKINEFFVDANIKNKVYFRTGKQVLQWGTGYLWNPSDLINIDRKDFADMSKIREGTYGEKIQIPWSAKQNTYFFIGSDDAQKAEDLSCAAKYEFLVGETEMAFSAWGKGGYKPVYAYEFSGAKIGSFNVYGEVGFYPSDDKRQNLNYDTLAKEKEPEDWNPKACMGFTQFFDKGDIKDGISLTTEFYYNGAGYDQNIIERIATGTYPSPGDKQEAMDKFMSLYQPYMNSKYYMAIFGSVTKFMNPDVTLNINAIGNLVDHSTTLITGIHYNPALTDFSFDFKITGYFGDDNTEATFLGKRWSIFLGTKILF